MNDVLRQLQLFGIIPVVAIENSADAEPLADALINGGLPCAEITFRTAAAKDSISAIAKKFPAMTLGAGTVLTIDQVKSAVEAGAKFIVSPGLNTKVVEYCLANSIPVTPGIATPTEVETALELGLEVVKFFPAEQNGGIGYLRALGAPYGKLLFIPTGGIDEANILSYLKFPKVLACGGSWMVKQELISNHQFDEIQRLTFAAVMKMLGFSLRHIGMNCLDAEKTKKEAAILSRLFGLPQKDTDGSIFVGTEFEVLKRVYLGEHGHIAVATNFIERAVAYYERLDVGIKKETLNIQNGKLQTVYLDVEVAGFAFHLVQKQDLS